MRSQSVDIETKVNTLLNRSLILRDSNTRRALVYAHKAFLLAGNSDKDILKGRCIYSIGICNYVLQNYKNALELLTEANKLFTRIDDKIYIARTLNGIGSIYLKLEEFNKGLKYYLEAHHILKDTDEKRSILVALSGIGSAYGYLKKYRLSLKYTKMALEVNPSVKSNDDNKSIMLNNVASAYQFLGKYELALRFHKKALGNNVVSNNIKSLILRNLAATKFKMGFVKNALIYINRALKFAELSKDKEDIGDSLLFWGRIMIALNRYNVVIDTLSKNEDVIKETNSLALLVTMNKLLSTCYEKTRQHKKAIQRLKQAHRFGEKLLDLSNNTKTKKLQTLHEFNVSQLQNQKVSQEIFSRRLLENQEAERKRISSDLHDSLGQSLLLINNKLLLTGRKYRNSKLVDELNEISSMTTKAIDEVREITQNLRPYELDRLGLTEAINSIVEKFNKLSRLKIKSIIQNVDTIISQNNEILLYRIIQECFNNIYKHSNANVANIKIAVLSKNVKIEISDNGKGFNFEKIKEGSTGLGWKGIHEKVSILNGKLRVTSNESSGTKIKVLIPVK